MKRLDALIAVLERIATALEQLAPALTQATREARYTAGRTWSDVTFSGSQFGMEDE